MFHVFDGDAKWEQFTDISAAKQSAEDHITNVDPQPEWPDWINHIGVYDAPKDCELPDEDGTLLYYAAECNHRDADAGSGCDYFCDYRLEKVNENQQPKPAFSRDHIVPR
jgi:hypothetical protein